MCILGKALPPGAERLPERRLYIKVSLHIMIVERNTDITLFSIGNVWMSHTSVWVPGDDEENSGSNLTNPSP